MKRLTSLSALLDELSPDLPATDPSWDDVLLRAQLLASAAEHSAGLRRRWTRRRLLMVAAAALAIVVPIAALAAARGWWFFDFPDTPPPLTAPVVVTSGSWSGHGWKLVAYNSETAGTCWSITFDDQGQSGGSAVTRGPGAVGDAGNALGCGSVVGVQPPDRTKIDIPTLTYMTRTSAGGFPRWIAGPVVDTATNVVVRYRNGVSLRIPTTPSVVLGRAGWFGPVRFFAAPLPLNVSADDLPVWLAGLDNDGKVVACFNPVTATHGYSVPEECGSG
jgi:hypothetical protein